MKMPGSMQALMKQANQLQSKMKKTQEELAKREYDGTSGGGAVKITINGEYKMMAIKISPDAAGDVDMLQDLILTATNDAVRICKETTAKEMEKVTGGLNIPGMF
ncbi:MAG: YbaB/EbfC family nucleoid-associated protein [Pseudobdellovibrionaceae bacterium]